MAITQDQSWISKNWNHGVAANHEVFLVPEVIFLVPEIFMSANFEGVLAL